MDVPAILKSWGFEELTDVFLGHEIDAEAFNNLTENVIKELIPKIGVRIKFVKKYEEYKKGSNFDNQSTSPSPSTSKASEDSESSEDLPLDHTAETYLRRSFRNESELDSLLNPRENLNLEHVLRSTWQGRNLLLHYNKNKNFERGHRKLLVELIINYVSQLSADSFVLNNTQLESISHKIVDLFPTETKETYYVKPIRKSFSKSEKSIPAKGRLVDRYRNCRNKLKRSGLLEISECQADKLPSTIEEEVQSSKDWLEIRNEPWSDVIHHWKKTFSLRRHSTAETISGFFSEWPILNHSNAPSLIDIDFNLMFESEYVLSYDKWNGFFDTIYNNRVTYITDKEALSIINIY